MALNPYSTALGGADPLTVLARTPMQLASLVSTLGPQGLEASLEPGKWDVRQIICHLADCEIAFAFRYRQTLAEPHHIIQPFDQDAWSTPYPAMDAHQALAVFTAVRNWNLALLEMAPEVAWTKPVTHPERGAMTLRNILETAAGHDRNHLAQIEAIAAR